MAINLSTLVNQTNPVQLAKAWIRFNSSGTILSSFNVSSFTINSTGNFTINFTTATADANYAVQFMAQGTTSVSTYVLGSFGVSSSSTTSCSIFSGNTNALAINPILGHVLIFGN